MTAASTQTEPAGLDPRLPPERVVEALSSDAHAGLTEAEAAARLQRYGPNSIAAEHGTPVWRLIVRQFNSPLVWLLLLAGALSLAFEEWLDGVAILLVIVINAVIGFLMEFQAERGMEALKKMTRLPARVVRGGATRQIDSTELVPGDLLFLEAGDMVPADARLLHAADLQVEEAALTGESLPVEKRPGELPADTPLPEQTNAVFSGTAITRGHAHAIVTATGAATQLGQIAELVRSSEQAATPLEQKLAVFSRRLLWITLGLLVVIFAAGLWAQQPLWTLVKTSIALAVAAIPEGLPIVTTLALASGMLRMARRNVLVRKLSAVETLGSTSIICTDKTGTLTENKLEVTAAVVAGGTWSRDTDGAPAAALPVAPLAALVEVAALCHTAETSVDGSKPDVGDPLETALIRFAIGIEPGAATWPHEHPKRDEVPFSSDTKIMVSWHDGPPNASEAPARPGRVALMKGAAEEVLARCSSVIIDDGRLLPLTDAMRQEWLERVEALAVQGLRVIAAARRPETSAHAGTVDAGFAFVGLYGLLDPPRADVRPALEQCRLAGIEVVMVTGDHPVTARAIAGQLGLIDAATGEADGLVLGRDMAPYETLDEAARGRWRCARVFARVSPRQKLDLVQVLQEGGAVVAMTGDGVNDAPALKKSDIGIAMGQRGTQVAQAVADMVLRDDSFKSIVAAVRQGRVILDNIRKFLVYLLSCNLSELVVIAAAAIFFIEYQLKPLQILFINLVTDVLPALALGVTHGSAHVMDRKPRPADEPIIDTVRWRRIAFYALVIGATTLGALVVRQYWPSGGVVHGNTILFFALIFNQLIHVLNMGTLDANFFRTEVARNRVVWYALGICLTVLVLVYQIPMIAGALGLGRLEWREWGVCLGAGIVAATVIRLGKRLAFFQRV